MNFFEEQDKARRNTKLLVFFFLLAIVGLSVALYVVAELVLTFQSQANGSESQPLDLAWNPDMFFLIVSLTLTIVSLGTLFRTLSFSSGGKVVALAMNGVLVRPETRDRKERQLINVVSEMAIASGIPTPDVYLIPDESINAFAAGTKVNNAVIGITKGALHHFTRDELQGVVAHEFSHIFNGDMRLNIRLTGLIFGLIMLGLLGTILMYVPHRSRDKGGVWLLLFGIGLRLVGFIGELCGYLIRSAVSRQREFLADASAVQFTRDPKGITGALNKIANVGSTIKSKESSEFAHFFFSDASSSMVSKASSLLSTHPPLKQRIERLGGKLKLDEEAKKSKKGAEEPRSANKSQPKTSPANASSLTGALQATTAGASNIALQVAAAPALLNLVGNISQQSIDTGSKINNQINPLIEKFARDAYSCRAVIYAMLLDQNAGIRTKQLEILKQYADTNIFELLKKITVEVEKISQHHYFPIMLESLPALRELSPQQRTKFTNNLEQLVKVDTDITLIDFSLYASIFHYLEVIPKYKNHEGKYPSDQQIGHLFTLLSSKNVDKQQASFLSALRALKIKPKLEEFEVDQAMLGLLKLSKLPLKMRREIAQIAVDCVQFDGEVNADEYDMLRTLFFAFDLPLPVRARL